MINRREFVQGSAGSLAAVGVLGCGRGQAMDEPMLRAVGEAVLPGELGGEGVARIVGDFLRWANAYRPGAELNHGYGTGDLRNAPDDPAPAWHDQLRALDRAGRSRHGTGFVSLELGQRRRLIEEALADVESPAIPSPINAPHIILAVLGYFYRTPEATDLAYRAAIKKQTCRPLADAPQRPVSLDPGLNR